MAEGKKSFLLYCDLIHTVRKMPKEKAGELLLHILEYVNDNNPETDDLLLQLVFEPIKQQLKRDLEKWSNISVTRSEIGKLAGIKSGEARRNKMKQNEPIGSETNQNEHVSDSVNVNVTVKDNIEQRKLAFANSLSEFKDVYKRETLKKFHDYWTEKNKSGTKMKFELEKTWETSLRLKKWASNEKNFNKTEQAPNQQNTGKSTRYLTPEELKKA